MTALSDLIEYLGTRRVMQDDLIPYRYQKGTGKLCLVLGDNATGKSMVRRLLMHAVKEQKFEPIPLSMQGRSGDGGFGLKGMVYGDEDWKSTGHNSVQTVQTMIKTSEGRAKDHVVCLDEPDIGLSDRWARSLGRALYEFMSKPPVHLVALFLTTHRVSLVRELLLLKPHVLLVGPEWPQNLEDWLTGDQREPEPLDALGTRGIDLFRRIDSAVKEN